MQKQTDGSNACPFFSDISFLNNGYFPRYSTNSSYSIVRPLQNVQAFVEAHFYVSNWLSSEGLDCPRTTYFDFFSAPPQKLIKQFIITVVSVTNSLDPQPDIRPTALALVTDHRTTPLKGATGLKYLATNAFINPSNPITTTILSVEDHRAIQLEQSIKRGHSSLRPSLVCAMVAITILPLVLVLLKMSPKTKNKQQINKV
jgi:hypothetical protein